MQGLSVVTSDDHKAGQVVAEQGDFLIVESGTLRKQKHVLPKVFATTRGDVVCATVTWDILKDSPTVSGDGNFDHEAVAEHYGLVDHFEEAPVEGYGESVPGDPAYGPDQAARAAGKKTEGEERVALRESLHPGSDAPPHTSPSITGGDRYKDAESS